MTIADAQLDHIVPMTNGGTDDPSNLQFIIADVNQMKKDLHEDRFFMLINIMSRNLAETGKIKAVDESLVPRLKVAK